MSRELPFWKKGVPVVAPGSSKRFECDSRFYQANLAEKCGSKYLVNLNGLRMRMDARKSCGKSCEGAIAMREKKYASNLISNYGARKEPSLPEEMRNLELPIVPPVPEGRVANDEVEAGLLIMQDAIVAYPGGKFEIKQVPMLTEKGADIFTGYISILVRKGQKAATKHLMEKQHRELVEEVDEMESMESEYV
ncbi:MAG: hypothetical protein LBT59_28515 [Clostridiales bacterium]|nr:hypothetical protein [Clostridiales bacterium]